MNSFFEKSFDNSKLSEKRQIFANLDFRKLPTIWNNFPEIWLSMPVSRITPGTGVYRPVPGPRREQVSFNVPQKYENIR